MKQWLEGMDNLITDSNFFSKLEHNNVAFINIFKDWKYNDYKALSIHSHLNNYLIIFDSK
jgi:hypothetical protein